MVAIKSLVLTTVFTFVSTLAGLTAANAQDRRLMIFEDADYAGHDYQTIKDVSLDECQIACLQDLKCKALTYNSEAKWCFKKSDHGELSTFPGATSARVADGAPAIKGPKPLDISFLPEDLSREAKRFTKVISSAKSKNVSSASGRLARTALEGQQFRDARTHFAAALANAPANSNKHSLWIGLARSLLSIETDDYNERYSFPEEATSAILNGLPLATTKADQAYDLRLLAHALERRQLYRPAMSTLKASLAVEDDDRTTATLARLRLAHGFRMLDYSVDSDAVSPRACVQFSEDLIAKGTDYADYVTLDGGPAPAVSRETHQICVDGLTHGQRYRLSLRKGLPSSIGEALPDGIELTIYVRDRSPAIRFTGSNYVLPKTGAKGIPIVSINTELVKAEIYRVGERAMIETIRHDMFLSQLNSYRVDEISGESGQEVWKGEMPVRSVQNKEVVTAFPIDEILPNPEPGVYVMVAKPDHAKQDEWENQATQWFVVTDIGLASLQAEDGVHIFARSLTSAAPLANADIKLIAHNNEILGEGRTGPDGHFRFAPGLARGEGALSPAIVVAEAGGKDFTFIDLTKPSFDLTDRGVGGRAAPGPLDVFMVPERGVYRPGETVHLTALLRDDKANAVSGVPLTFIINRPDGVEYARKRSQSAGLGGHNYDVALDASVKTGTWTVSAHSDPKGPALAQVKFLVEDFVPEKLEFTLTSPAKVASTSDEIVLDVDGRYLFGAPAANLRLEGEINITAATLPPEGFAGYHFGLDGEDVSASRKPLQNLPATDSAGKATFPVSLSSLPETTGRLDAQINLRLREPGGRTVTRNLTLPVVAQNPLIGIKPMFEDDAVPEGSTAEFDIKSLGPDGRALALGGASWQLLKLDRRYQWYRLDGSWQYEPVTRSQRVTDGRIDIAGSDPTRLSLPVKWGRYRLEITGDGASGPVTSVEFNAGWYVADASTETPDTLEVSLDKSTYKSGENAQLRLTARHAGQALITITAGRLVEMKTVDVAKGTTTVDFAVSDEWGAGAYVTAALYRPMDVDAGRNPARSIGLDWLAVDNSSRKLGVEFSLPTVARPKEQLTLPISISGLKPGEAARVTVAAVDVGILNLTAYKPPHLSDWYFGQRRLRAEMRDLYGQLIDGMQGARGAIRSGGDASGLSLSGTPDTEKPVSLYSGIVNVDAEGKAEITFDVPPFNGTLRLMAMAWSATAVGQGTQDLVVREKVVLTSSLPRFLTPNDTTRLRLDITNLDAPAGDWRLDVASLGPVDVGEKGQGAIRLEKGVRFAAEIPITATGVGDAVLTATLTHTDGTEIIGAWDLPVKAAQPTVTRRNLQSLSAAKSGKAGGRLSLSSDLVSDFVPGSARITLTASKGLFTDLPGLLNSLDRYPYGCAEQTTSRALPLLYANDVARQAGLGDDQAIKARVDAAILRVLQYQGSNGSFGLWGPGGNDLWLDAYVTDFLSRARARGYTVPGVAFDQALNRLQNGIAYINDLDGGEGIAYALYILAHNARASMGDLRYYVDTRLDEFTTTLAKAHLGGAIGLMGDRNRANVAIQAAFEQLAEPMDRHTHRSDYGSRLRDGAALVTIARQAGNGNSVERLTNLVEAIRAEVTHTSTQENAWMLLAAYSVMEEDDNLEFDVDGSRIKGRLTRSFTGASLDSSRVQIENLSNTDVKTVVSVTGVPIAPEPARSNGLTIKRSYFTTDGTLVDAKTVGQNERFVVVLEVEEENEWPSRLLIVDHLPAGLEIENPRLIGAEEASDFAWVGDIARPSHTEFRDDRFVASFEKTDGDASYKLAYLVRAVTPGKFSHPPAIAEDMYRPGIEARTSLGSIEVVGPQAR